MHSVQSQNSTPWFLADFRHQKKAQIKKHLFSTFFQHCFNIVSILFQHCFNIVSTLFLHIYSTLFRHFFNIVFIHFCKMSSFSIQHYSTCFHHSFNIVFIHFWNVLIFPSTIFNIFHQIFNIFSDSTKNHKMI